MFVAAMEDVLAVYCLAHDPRFPVVCMDESSKQLVGEVRVPIPAAPGRAQIVDHEYVRHGVATLFVEVEPLAGRRHVEVTARRTRQDWARFIKAMLDERYPGSGRCSQKNLQNCIWEYDARHISAISYEARSLAKSTLEAH